MSWALVAVLVVGVSVAFVLRLPSPWSGVATWLGLALPYAGLALLAGLRLWKKGLARPLFRFRPGDPSLGFALGVLMLLSAWALSKLLLPLESVGHAWLLRLFLLAGDASSSAVLCCLLAIAVCDEIVWRGWIQTELSLRLGVRRGWVATAVLYAAAHLPTLRTLGDPLAGPNPLIVLTALGCGLCWGFLRERTGRIVPGLFSHAAFVFLASQYLGRFI
jgi:membrane protease YdiL (CAAX protease family)